MTELQQLTDKLIALEKRVAALEASIAKPTVEHTFGAKETKKTSIKEFMLTKHPANDVGKTLVIGYFLEKFESMASFNIDDISTYFQLAKEPVPDNINDKINMNIKKGHMTEAKEKKNSKKAWYLTSSGEQFLERGFNA